MKLARLLRLADKDVMLGIEPLLLQCGGGSSHSKDKKGEKASSRGRDTRGGEREREEEEARRVWRGWLGFGWGGGGGEGQETGTGDTDSQVGDVVEEGMYSAKGVGRLFAVYRRRQSMRL
jgi:hypothetical protein